MCTTQEGYCTLADEQEAFKPRLAHTCVHMKGKLPGANRGTLKPQTGANFKNTLFNVTTLCALYSQA